MLDLSALAAGVAIGLSIAAPVGPMTILCMSRTLQAGVKAGLSTGAGASTVQVAYAGLILLGFQQASPALQGNQALIGLASAALLAFFAWRILRGGARARGAPEPGSVLGHYTSAVAFNCLNPMLPVLLIGAVGAIIGPEPPIRPAVQMLILGVWLGTAGWWVVLVLATAALRERLQGGVLRGINHVAAVAMMGLAVVTLTRALGA